MGFSLLSDKATRFELCFARVLSIHILSKLGEVEETTLIISDHFVKFRKITVSQSYTDNQTDTPFAMCALNFCYSRTHPEKEQDYLKIGVHPNVSVDLVFPQR